MTDRASTVPESRSGTVTRDRASLKGEARVTVTVGASTVTDRDRRQVVNHLDGGPGCSAAALHGTAENMLDPESGGVDIGPEGRSTFAARHFSASKWSPSAGEG